MKLWAAVTVVTILSQKALLMCPYVSSWKFSVLAPRCTRALLHNLQLTSDRCLIFASHLAIGMVPAVAIISRFYVSKRPAVRSNTSLRTLCFHFAVTWSLPSTCHMQPGWLILPCSALARTHDFKNFLSSIQVFCCRTFRVAPCFDTISHIVACVRSPLCHHLYTIFISSPECAHLSARTCKLLFMFLHLILCLINELMN